MAIASTSPHAGVDPEVDRLPSPQLNFEIPEALLAEVDFKWLMAGHGWQVDMARLGDDPTYAARLLTWAMNSDSPALRECAAALMAQKDDTGALGQSQAAQVRAADSVAKEA